MMVEPVPGDAPALAPYLCLRDVAAAIDFYTRAFGAAETLRFTMPDGGVGHAEMRLCGCVIMLTEESDVTGMKGPGALGGSPVSLHLYVPDVDVAMKRAAAAGAVVVSPAENQFYGDRRGGVRDPFGYVWFLASRREDLTEEEMQSRFQALYGGAGG